MGARERGFWKVKYETMVAGSEEKRKKMKKYVGDLEV